MNANETQVGGTHYQSAYQHWDLVLEHMENRYMEGQISKYVSRSRKKNGVQDLRKARHFVDKLIEACNEERIEGFGPRDFLQAQAIRQFIEANGLNEVEAQAVRLIACWHSGNELREIAVLVDVLIRTAEQAEAELQARKAGAPARQQAMGRVGEVGLGDGSEPGKSYVGQG